MTTYGNKVSWWILDCLIHRKITNHHGDWKEDQLGSQNKKTKGPFAPKAHSKPHLCLCVAWRQSDLSHRQAMLMLIVTNLNSLSGPSLEGFIPYRLFLFCALLLWTTCASTSFWARDRQTFRNGQRWTTRNLETLPFSNVANTARGN